MFYLATLPGSLLQGFQYLGAPDFVKYVCLAVDTTVASARIPATNVLNIMKEEELSLGWDSEGTVLALMLVTSTAVPRIRMVAPHGGESRSVSFTLNFLTRQEAVT